VSEPAVTLSGLVRRTAGRLAIDGISVTIAGGGPVALVGPSGAGKSSLLRLVAGLLRPDAGSLVVLGHDAVRDPASIQAVIGYMPQLTGLHDHLAVREELRLHAALRNLAGGAAQERIGELLDRTGLAAASRTRIAELPRLERYRLGIACAVIGRPRLLLLDEPGVGLDPVSRRSLLELAADLGGEGCTLLWSTARFADAERSPHVLLLQAGKLLADGPPERLAAALAGRVHIVAAAGRARRPAAARLRALAGIQDIQLQAAGVRVLTPTPLDSAALASLAEVGAVTPATARLEECFVALSAAGQPPASTLRVRPIAGDREPAIVARGLARLPYLHPLDLSVHRGEIIGLVGAAGAGKTTLLRMVCGLAAPNAGTVTVVGSTPAAARRRIGYMPAGESLYGELSARQNLGVLAGACRVRRRHRAERINALLADLGLDGLAGRRARELSPGQRRLLSLAATLVHEPEILLLDQPTAGVDPLTRREIWRHLETLASAGAAILVAIPPSDEAERCDRLVVLDRGRPIASASPADLGPVDELLAAQAGRKAGEQAA
jgi:ABC-2 type transport system ATP-binding protein